MKDVTGQRFGRLIAEGLHHTNNHKRFWLCKCDCEKRTIVRQDQLTTGKTISCGCYMREIQLTNLKKRQIKKQQKDPCINRIDGHYKTWNPLKHENPRLYRIWQAMKSRCYYPKNKCYHCYGGRGISICDEWKSSFNSFALWALSNGYKDDLSIDRIDVDGNYEPNNCRFATNGEQQKNKRKSPSRITQEACTPGVQTQR